ncbi:hypothetical protein NCCP2495_13850 [Dietzia sp. NCCP-2495]|nr:hypothetical protein NCCP2495_13850 [Dietzia sp. NCCP-2495]
MRVEPDELRVAHTPAVLRRRFDRIDGEHALDGLVPEQHAHQVRAEIPAAADNRDSAGRRAGGSLGVHPHESSRGTPLSGDGSVAPAVDTPMPATGEGDGHPLQA